MRYDFGDCLVDLSARELTRGGRRVHLAPKALRMLELLIESRPRVLTKQELHERLWPQTFVSDSSLARLAAELRAALGDDARSPRFVRTAHRIGYAFIGSVDATRGAAARASGSRCRLLLGERVLALELGENLVGRGDDVAVRIDSAKVSRVHARIEVTGTAATLEDLRSKNGTFVRGQRIEQRVTLKDGDEICIGPVLLVFQRQAAPRSTETESA